MIVNRKLMEFKVTNDCLLPTGTPIYATHFVPGQLVDVCGISKGIIILLYYYTIILLY